ncbi:MAG: nicotinate phosphoribosyltransferase [Aquificaceae bacterium]|nr:nicotinate phosphoribosyltransferase [Aquificaceae bacterium]
MKVNEYVEKGLKNLVEDKPEGYEQLGKCTSGCHSVSFFLKGSAEKVEDIKFKATKRCKKLLAVADLVAEKIKEKGKVHLEEEQILSYFSEEAEKDKIKDRLSIVKGALGLA